MNKYLDTQQLCRNASWYEYGMNYDYEAKFAKKVRTPFFYIILFNRLGAGLYCERYVTSLFFHPREKYNGFSNASSMLNNAATSAANFYDTMRQRASRASEGVGSSLNDILKDNSSSIDDFFDRQFGMGKYRTPENVYP